MNDRNVVVICLDTVRQDYFEQHATELPSRADVRYSNCRAPSSWTVPSHASFLTGTLPHEHGAHAYNTTFERISEEETFLGDLDHRTLCVSANPYVSSAFGADSLFDEFVDVAPSVVFADGMYLKDFDTDRDGPGAYAEYAFQALQHRRPFRSLVNGASHVLGELKPNWVPSRGDDGGRTVARAARRLTAQASEPYFLFLNVMEAHAPFSVTQGYDSDYRTVPRSWSSKRIDYWDVNTGTVDPYREDIRHYRTLYGGAIDYLDRLLADLVDDLIDDADRETTVVVTADHGENLVYPEDDGLIEHKGSLSEGLLHVPLYVLNPPDSFDAATDDLFSLLDLGPLVDRLLGRRAEFEYAGTVPAELIGLGSSDPPLPPEEYAYWDRAIRCVYRDTEKLLWDSTGERYRDRIDSEQDCWRSREATGIDVPRWARSCFHEGIDAFERARPSDPSVDVSSGTAERLEDLGYM